MNANKTEMREVTGDELQTVEGGMSDSGQKLQNTLTEANRIDYGSDGGTVFGAAIRKLAGLLGV